MKSKSFKAQAHTKRVVRKSAERASKRRQAAAGRQTQNRIREDHQPYLHRVAPKSHELTLTKLEQRGQIPARAIRMLDYREKLAAKAAAKLTVYKLSPDFEESEKAA